MKFDWQRILMIIMFVASIFLFGFFIYWFFWRPLIGPSVTETPTATTTVGGLTGSGTAGTRTSTASGLGGLTGAGNVNIPTDLNPSPGTTPSKSIDANLLTNNPAYFASMSKTGQLCYYNPNDGKLYKVDAAGNNQLIVDKTFYSLSSATFDSACDKVILNYPDGSNIVYDLSSNKQYTLPAHWQDFSFSDTGKQIAFKNIGLDVENRFLVASNYDGTQAKIIEQIGVNAYKVNTNWSPNNQVVATYVEGLDASRSQVYFIGQNNENFKSMIVEGRDFKGIWSPSGNRMLYSVYDPNNEQKPALWISDAYGETTGSNRQKIPLETWADKCAFASNNFALCIVPQSMPSGAGLDRDNLMRGISDSVYAINLVNGTTALIATPTNITNISSLYFSEQSPNTVFLVSKDNGYVYKVSIQN